MRGGRWRVVEVGGEAEGVDPSSVAMSDLFSTLFLLLLSLLVVSLIQLHQARREHMRLAEAIREKVGTYQVVISKLTEIRQLLERERLLVEVNPESGEVIILDDGVMFGAREAELSVGARGFLERFASVYFGVILDPSLVEHIRWVVVEGHASVEGEELQNLSLSAERAHAVAEFLLRHLEARAFNDPVGLKLTEEEREARLASCEAPECARLRALKARLLVAGRGEFGANKRVEARDRSVRFRLHFQSDLFDLYEDPKTKDLLLSPRQGEGG